jgi:hypothetical protein
VADTELLHSLFDKAKEKLTTASASLKSVNEIFKTCVEPNV